MHQTLAIMHCCSLSDYYISYKEDSKTATGITYNVYLFACFKC
jgi:hypothetical protein